MAKVPPAPWNAVEVARLEALERRLCRINGELTSAIWSLLALLGRAWQAHYEAIGLADENGDDAFDYLGVPTLQNLVETMEAAAKHVLHPREGGPDALSKLVDEGFFTTITEAIEWAATP